MIGGVREGRRDGRLGDVYMAYIGVKIGGQSSQSPGA
jgi:hypothetical protein